VFNKGFRFLLALLLAFPSFIRASEVVPETRTQVMVRAHPRTGKNYVVVTDANAVPPAAPSETGEKEPARPDYRMLEPGREARKISYEGPSSSRTKVYVLAGSLAAAGAAAGLLLPVSAAAGTASGGAGGFAAAGGGVAAGTLGTVSTAMNRDPGDDDLALSSQTAVVEGSEKAGDRDHPESLENEAQL